MKDYYDELDLLARWLTRVRDLGDDLPAGPWTHRRTTDGALLLENGTDGEPLALIYAGLPLARYFEAVAPAVIAAAVDDEAPSS